MVDDPVVLADRLSAHGRINEAMTLIQEAAAAGNGNAMFRLAICKLAGELLPRDVPGARLLLRRSAAEGNVDATHIEVALTANGSGGAADWTKARELLGIIAVKDSIAADQCAMLDRMALTTDGSPSNLPQITQVAVGPSVWHVPGLFAPEECLHVAQTAVDLLAPATVVDPRTGQNVANPVRTSDGAVIGPTRETLVIQALNRRIAAVSDTDIRQGEALAVLRYNPGQQFRPHLDSIAGAGNQRVKTVLIYLNHGFTGGATRFHNNGLRVTPRAGDAIIFDNVRNDGSIDPQAQHAGEVVLHGTKWLATRWIRARPFDVWTGPEAA